MMFFNQPKTTPAEEMSKFYRARPFDIGFRNKPAADANPGYYPCPLVAGPLDGYWSGMMNGTITAEEMDEVTLAFNKEMATVSRRDNSEELRACILERLWLKPYGKMREAQRKHAEKQKQRREYDAHVQLLKERELEKKAREEELRAKRAKELRRRTADAEEELEEGEVQESPPVKQQQLSPSLAPKRGRAANASWRKEKRARVIQDDDSD